MLNRLVRELEYPDRADAVACSPGEPTQLDRIVRSIFGQLMVRLLKSQRMKSMNLEADLKAFTEDPVAELGREHLRKWFEADMEIITTLFDKELARCGIELQPSRRAWIQVMIRYLTTISEGPVRQFCRDWISAKPLAEDDWITLGLKIGDNVEPDLSMESRNERCFERLRDLCLISSFYRPFLSASTRRSSTTAARRWPRRSAWCSRGSARKWSIISRWSQPMSACGTSAFTRTSRRPTSSASPRASC